MGPGDLPPTDLTRFKIDALAAIAAVPDSPGKDVLERLEADGYDHVNHGRLYPNLDDLAELDLASKRERDGRTNAYDLTPEGRDLLRGYGRHLADRATAQSTLDDVFVGDAEVEEAVETAVEAGRAAPLCPDCKRRISVDEFRGDAEEAHDCPAREAEATA